MRTLDIHNRDTIRERCVQLLRHSDLTCVEIAKRLEVSSAYVHHVNKEDGIREYSSASRLVWGRPPASRTTRAGPEGKQM